MMQGELRQPSLPIVRQRSHRHLALAVIGTVFLLDQVSKGWVLTQFTAIPRVIELTSFCNILLTWNYGMSFGFFNHASIHISYALLIVSLIVIFLLIIWSSFVDIPHIKLSIHFIIGGASGNALDRLRHYSVIDFVDLHIFSWHWPAFNMADLAITIGAIVLMSDALFVRPDSNTLLERYF